MVPSKSQLAVVVLLLLASSVTAYSVGVSQGVEEASSETVDVDLAPRNGPSGTVAFDCQNDTCNATVSVTEWGDYETLAVQNMTGTVAQTYYIHPGDETVTIQDLPKRDQYNEIALYAPVKEPPSINYSYAWHDYYSDSDGNLQSFSVHVERNYTIGVDTA